MHREHQPEAQLLAAAPDLTGEPDFDEDALDSFFMGNAALFTRIRAMFIEQAPAALECIRRSMEANEDEEARRVAHKLKGSAATVGAQGLRNFASASKRPACRSRRPARAGSPPPCAASAST